MNRAKFYASLGLALACLPSYGQDAQVQSISLKCPAGPLSKIIPALAKATGLRMSVDGPIAKSIVQISVKDADPLVVMEKIAAVTSGRWDKSDDGYRLVLDSDQSRDDLRNEQKARSEAIKASLDNMQKAGSGGSGSATTSIREMRMDTRGDSAPVVVSMGNPNSSTNKAIIQMLQMIGPATLAQIQADSRVVYALPANRAQKALPSTVSRLINTLIAELPQREGPPPVAAKVHLVLSRQLMGGMLMAELKVGDPGGRTLIRDMVSVQYEPQPGKTEIKLQNGTKKVVLSEIATDLAKVFAEARPVRGGVGSSTTIVSAVVVSGGPGSGPVVGPPVAENETPQASEKAKEALLNPDKYEPLAFLPGEALQTAADADELNMVACIPDAALIPASTSLGGSLTAQGVLNNLGDWQMVGQYKDGFITIQPSEPAAARSFRIDRPSMATALKLITSQGYLTLDQKASYVNAQPFATAIDNFEIRMLSAVNSGFGGSMQQSLFSGERKMLKFYAQLHAAQRQALFSGRGVVLGSLMPVPKNLVYDMAYNSISGLSIDQPGEPGPRRAMMGDMGNDPTEVLSNGVPEQATITLQTRMNDLAFGVSKSGSRVPVSPSAFSMTFSGDPSTGLTPMMVNAASQYSKYQLGKQTQLNFRFQITPAVYFTRTLVDDKFDIKSKLLSFSELPDWFRSQADEAQKRMDQMKDRIQIGGQGGQKPPSP